jgi:hypothetical protein
MHLETRVQNNDHIVSLRMNIPKSIYFLLLTSVMLWLQYTPLSTNSILCVELNLYKARALNKSKKLSINFITVYNYTIMPSESEHQVWEGKKTKKHG